MKLRFGLSTIVDEMVESGQISKKLTREMKNIFLLQQPAGGFSSGSLLIEAQDVTDPSILIWMAELEQPHQDSLFE